MFVQVVVLVVEDISVIDKCLLARAGVLKKLKIQKK
jgi:hypothetical protein